MLMKVKMPCFHGTISVKAVKCCIKCTLLTVSFVLLTLSISSRFLTSMNATLFTHSTVNFSWRALSDSGNSYEAAGQTRIDYMRTEDNDVQPDGFRSKSFPSCIIIGVSKCGTKALLEYLTLHPDVVGPAMEINFFCNKSLLERGVNWYIQQMPFSRAHQITVEKSPDYFQCHYCADLIYAMANNTKLILLLRDPVERLISQYMQFLAKHPNFPAIEEWVINPKTHLINTKLQSVMIGAYSEHLPYWLNVFPRHQIHIIESDSLRVSPVEEMKQVEKFLNLKQFYDAEDFYFNISRGFYCTRRRSTGKTKCLGKSKGRVHITVDKIILEKLYKFYQPFNDNLAKILGYRFPWS